MSSIYVTESHFYKGFTGQHISYVGAPTNESFTFSYEPAPANGSVLVSVLDGIGHISLFRGGSWFEPRSETGITSLPNKVDQKPAIPVSGFFATLDEAKFNTAVGQFAVCLDGGLFKLITHKPNGLFDVMAFEFAVHTTQQGMHWVEMHDLPKPVGVFGPVAAEGAVVGLAGGPVHAVAAKSATPVQLPATNTGGSDPVATPVQVIPDNPSTAVPSGVGGGWYYQTVHRSHRR